MIIMATPMMMILIYVHSTSLSSYLLQIELENTIYL